MHKLLFNLMVAVTISQCSISWARSPGHIPDLIKMQDNALTQGTIKFQKTVEREPTSATVEQDVLERQREYTRRGASQNEVKLQTPKFRKDAQLSLSPLQTTSIETLKFTKDLRFYKKTLSNQVNKNTEITHIYDGEDELIINHSTVVINPRKPKELAPIYRLFSLYTGNSFILGRGLSILRNLKIKIEDDTIVAKGIAPDGTRIQAKLQPQYGYLAKYIERRTSEGVLVTRLDLDEPIKVNNKVWIASVASYQTYRIKNRQSTPATKQAYKILDASINMPDEKIYRLPFDRDIIIVDKRLVRSVTYSYKKKSSRVKSKEELLNLTVKNLAKQEKRLAQINKENNTEKLGRNVTLFIPFLILVLLSGYYYIGQRLRKS